MHRAGRLAGLPNGSPQWVAQMVHGARHPPPRAPRYRYFRKRWKNAAVGSCDAFAAFDIIADIQRLDEPARLAIIQ